MIRPYAKGALSGYDFFKNIIYSRKEPFYTVTSPTGSIYESRELKLCEQISSEGTNQSSYAQFVVDTELDLLFISIYSLIDIARSIDFIYKETSAIYQSVTLWRN